MAATMTAPIAPTAIVDPDDAPTPVLTAVPDPKSFGLHAVTGDSLRVISDAATSVTWGSDSFKVKPIAMAADAPKTVVPDADSYFRPNGEQYFPRKIKISGGSDISDCSLMRTAHANRLPVLLYGPPGTGKTALAEAALGRIETLSGTADTETADFIGSWVQQPGGKFVWVDGPLIRAMEAGVPFLVDEAFLIDSRVLALVYSLMDGRDQLEITANPDRGIITVQPGFFVIAASNPDVPGAVASDALLSRFPVQIEVLTDFSLARRMGVPQELITMARALKRKAEAGEIAKSPQMRELLAFKKVASTFGQAVALSNLVSSADPGDRKIYADQISSVFGVDAGPLTIGD